MSKPAPELLPCPMCGNAGQHVYSKKYHGVRCDNEICILYYLPNANDQGYYTKENAYEAWNTRTPPVPSFNPENKLITMLYEGWNCKSVKEWSETKGNDAAWRYRFYLDKYSNGKLIKHCGIGKTPEDAIKQAIKKSAAPVSREGKS